MRRLRFFQTGNKFEIIEISSYEKDDEKDEKDDSPATNAEYFIRPKDTHDVYYRLGNTPREREITLLYHRGLCTSIKNFLLENGINGIDYSYEQENSFLDYGVKLGNRTEDELLEILSVVERKF